MLRALFTLFALSAPSVLSTDLQECLYSPASASAAIQHALGSVDSSGRLSVQGIELQSQHQEKDLVQLTSGEVMTSIPACRMTGTSNRTQRVNTLFDTSGNLQSISLQGACEKGGRPVKGLQDYATSVPLNKSDITPVKLKEAAAPAAYDEQGNEKAPEPEKSFLQKYWVYIVPAAVVLITSLQAPPPPEEEGAAVPAKK